MSRYFKAIDEFAVLLTRWVISQRWLVIALALAMTAAIGYGAKNLQLSTNYRVFFSSANPELQAFENLQNTYTKNDNFLFVFAPKSEQVFSQNTLTAIEEMTERAWEIPSTIRVDSIANFQHTYAEEDDLTVENLVSDAAQRDAAYFSDRKNIALNEPLLVDQLLNRNASVTAINVVLQYAEQSATEVPESVAVARALKAEFSERYPEIDIYLTGVSMLNNAFAETGQLDGQNLMPIMFGIIFLLALIFIRSVAATFSILLITILSTVSAMGFAGYVGIPLTPISMASAIVILTLAVADSVHIFISLRNLMKTGMDKISAIVEAVRINFLAVSITSLTTIVGFLALNFSDAPPFWHLGNMTAVGIAAAWLFSITLIPALISMLPFSASLSQEENWSQKKMGQLADWVILQQRKLMIGFGLAALALFSLIPTLQFNDQWVEYFDERLTFRTDSDAAQEYFGLYPIEYSVTAAGPGGVSEPEYLQNLEEFANFLRQQPRVTHVYSMSDIMKRLNKNMHGDDNAYYDIPDNRELSAQYLLLYELSLPYGLDLNDRINIDKSASRVTATLADSRSEEAKAFFNDVAQWQEENWPDYMRASPTSAAVMFTYISERNLRNMITGTTLGILAIAIIMMLALRSVGLGLLSLIPNAMPILATFGVWAILVGEVGFSVATVASIALGIIVDDTVHFLSKYVRARREQNLSAEDAIRYAFNNVGVAIVVNTIILAAGFFVLTTSAFKLNVDMGLMTLFSIIFALILDFLFLPTLLLLGKEKTTASGEATTAAQADGKAQRALAIEE